MILLSPCHPSATASLRADQRTLTQPCSSQALHRGGWASCAHALRRSPAPSRTPPASLRCPAESPLPAAPRRAAGRTGTARHGPISNGIRQGSTYLRAVLRLINNNDKQELASCSRYNSTRSKVQASMSTLAEKASRICTAAWQSDSIEACLYLPRPACTKEVRATHGLKRRRFTGKLSPGNIVFDGKYFSADDNAADESLTIGC